MVRELLVPPASDDQDDGENCEPVGSVSVPTASDIL
jgi:hypothetical protein